MDKKPGQLTFETDNLAVPEVHTNEEEVMEDIAKLEAEEAEEEEEQDGITFDNLAIPEIHFKKKQ